MASEWMQRGAAEVDQRGDLLRGLDGAGLEFQRPKVCNQATDAAHQQQASRKKVRQNRFSPCAGATPAALVPFQRRGPGMPVRCSCCGLRGRAVFRGKGSA
jgi:hypothetical protein